MRGVVRRTGHRRRGQPPWADATPNDQGATAVIPVDERPTEVIVPAATPPAAGRPSPAPAPASDAAAPAAPVAESAEARPRSRAVRVRVTVIAIVVALIALVVVADIVLRNVAEARIAEEVEANLPAGATGDVAVTIGGFSVIGQYLSGTMDQVQLSAPELEVQGMPIAVDVVAREVPVDLASPVEQLTATIGADPAVVNQLLSSQDLEGVEGDLVFGDGTVGYTDSVRFLGFPIEYTVTAQPVAAGDRVLLQPVGAEIVAGGGSLDLSGLLRQITGDDPVPVCVAQYLPEGVQVEQIEVTPTGAVVTLDADALQLDEASLTRTGTCD